MDTSVEPDAAAHVGKRNDIELYLGWVTGEPEYLDA
jgi:hypothetical protein